MACAYDYESRARASPESDGARRCWRTAPAGCQLWLRPPRLPPQMSSRRTRSPALPTRPRRLMAKMNLAMPVQPPTADALCQMPPMMRETATTTIRQRRSADLA